MVLGRQISLDAIHYLSVTKSYFNSVDSQNINHNAPFFVVEGWFERDENEEHIYCGLKRSQKKIFKRNQKEYDRISAHIGLIPLVIISPSDRDPYFRRQRSTKKVYGYCDFTIGFIVPR